MNRNSFISGLISKAKNTISPQAVVHLLKKKPVGYETKLSLSDGFFISKNEEGVYYCWFDKSPDFLDVQQKCSHFVLTGSGTPRDDLIFSLSNQKIEPLSGGYVAFPLAQSSERWIP